MNGQQPGDRDQCGRGLPDTRADRRTATGGGLTSEASPCSLAGQEERQLQMGSSRRTRAGGGDEAAGTALRTAVLDLELESRVFLENRALTFAASSPLSVLQTASERSPGRGWPLSGQVAAHRRRSPWRGLSPFDPPAGPPPRTPSSLPTQPPPPPALPGWGPRGRSPPGTRPT